VVLTTPFFRTETSGAPSTPATPAVAGGDSTPSTLVRSGSIKKSLPAWMTQQPAAIPSWQQQQQQTQPAQELAATTTTPAPAEAAPANTTVVPSTTTSVTEKPTTTTTSGNGTASLMHSIE